MTQMFLANFSTTSKAQRQVVDGREFLVAPVVATKALVMNGIYCDPILFETNAKKFEGVPVPVGHKFGLDGKPVPIANAPEQIIGNFRNVSFEDGKLKGEIWIDVAMANAKGYGYVVSQIEAGVAMDVSTAYGGMVAPGAGEVEGKKYHSVLNSITNADHLALLPHENGACAKHEGCGVFANAEQEKGLGLLEKLVSGIRSKFFAANELSHDDIRSRLRAALKAENAVNYYYIADVFDDHFIYQVEIPGGAVSTGNLMRNYSKTDNAISLGSEVVPVTSRIVYEPITNQEGSQMNRKEKIDALIANGKATEADRQHLMGLTDALFANVEKACGCPGTQPATQPAQQVANAQQGVTAEQIGEIVANTVNKLLADKDAKAEGEKKAALAARIVNSDKRYSVEELTAMPLSVLEKMANTQAPWYGGRGGVVVNTQQPTTWDAPEVIVNRQEAN
jgi:hypothetical protein